MSLGEPVSKIEKPDIDEQIAASIKNFSTLAKDEAARQRIALDMPEFMHKKAQLISAHFLLPAGARIVDMGCGRGEIAYLLALLNPRAEICGVDRDTSAIEFARKAYRLPNLSYRIDDVTLPDMDDESVDAIINSNILHHVYSVGRYDPQIVTQVLEQQSRKLKIGGTMLIRDTVMPLEGEYVLLELPDQRSVGADSVSLSDADLLVAFSQTARPIDNGSEGFFIEELPARRDKTRLFRLPHKWACEFIYRKNYRADWAKTLKEEYTFFTWQDYRRELTRLGLRMVYSAPYWNPWIVQNWHKGRFQLYNESYVALPSPATNHFILAQKVGDRQSLLLEERRPSQKPVGDLQIIVVRDRKTGALHDLVKRPNEHCDIVPYRITSDSRLVVYVRSGYPRPIVNAVLHGGHNLDGKKWSGHLIEPITMDTTNMTDNVEENRKAIFDHARQYARLRPKTEESWYVGRTYYPSPDRIDEAIEPIFIEVENPQKSVWPIREDKEIGFTEAGMITELDGCDILLASQVGLLPEPRLEMHVLELMSRYNIPFPAWIGDVMPKTVREQVKSKRVEDILKDAPHAEFEEIKAEPLSLRPVKSVFVEEGRVGQATRGLSAQDIEFVISHDGIENIAAIMPLTRDFDNNLLVALEPKILPVPNRLGGGDGAMLNVPSFVLPQNVKSIEDAKAYIAGKFGVKPQNVAQLGESYFTHTGVMPQRVYPFIVANPGKSSTWNWQYTMISGYRHFMAVFNWTYFSSVMTLKSLARVQMMISGVDGAPSMARDHAHMKNQGFSLSTEKIAVESKNTGYSAAPSRVLGQRPPENTGDGEIRDEKATHHPLLQQPAEPEPEIARQNKAAQKLIEALMMPHVGKRLSQSYAHALHLKETLEKIDVKKTPSIDALGQEIEALAEQIQKSGEDEKDESGKGKGGGKGEKGRAYTLAADPSSRPKK